MSFGVCYAQSPLTEKTLALDANASGFGAEIEDLAWLSGSWTGEGFGGTVEEIWSKPQANSMVGTFRMMTDGTNSFFEILLLEEKGNSVVYKVKHFNADFTAWEEKEDYIEFPLVKVEENKVFFHGLTLELDGEQCTHYLAMKQKDGTYKEARLIFTREK